MREKVVTTYIAYDGTEFVDEETCKQYERKNIMENKRLIMYDEFGQVLNYIDNPYRSCEESWYIVCKSYEDFKYLQNLFD